VYKRAPREYRVQISHRLLLDEEAPLEALLPLLLQHFGITIPPPSLSSSSSSSSSPSPTPDESDAHGSSSSYSLTHLSPGTPLPAALTRCLHETTPHLLIFDARRSNIDCALARTAITSASIDDNDRRQQQQQQRSTDAAPRELE